MVRPETKPDDVHGMLAARGILTSRGGRTSHAALVARQFGKPAVVGVADDGGRPRRAAAHGRRAGAARGRRGLDRRHDRRGVRGQARHRRARVRRSGAADAAPLGRRLPPARRVGERRLSGRRAARAPLRRRGHRPHAHRAHVLPDGAAADRAADDPRAGRRGARRVPRAAAADAARGLRGPVPRDGRRAGDDPADRSAAARVPAEPRRPAARRDRDRDAREDGQPGTGDGTGSAGARRHAQAEEAPARRGRAHARVESDAGPARRAAGHPPAGAGAHAGARDHRGRLHLRARGHQGEAEDHDPAHRAQQRAQVRAAHPRGRGAGGDEGAGPQGAATSSAR